MGWPVSVCLVPLDFDALVAPPHTAVVTNECQEGVLGSMATLPALADAARETGIVERMADLLHAARRAGVAVVHCLITHRHDNRGSNRNARLFVAAARQPGRMTLGSPAARLLPALGPEDSDLVLTRIQGLGPMSGTELDPVLRHLGVTTVIGMGVSLNVALTNLAFDAVDHGYQFVLPTDAAVGYPIEFGQQVIENTLSLVGTVTTTEKIVASWGTAAP